MYIHVFPVSHIQCMYIHCTYVAVFAADVVCLLVLLSSAEEQLVRINKVFQDVLKSPETRSLYDQLCNFRRVSDHVHQTVTYIIMHDCTCMSIHG